jgi:hypothetical protein
MAMISDSHVYESVGFSASTLRLFANALQFYVAALESDLAAVELDPDLKKLLDEQALRSFPIAREIKESKRMVERTEAMIPQAESMGDAEMHMSHGLARKLKSISLFYLAEMERKRNDLASTGTRTAYLTEMLDTKLLQMRETLEMGILRDIEPVALLVRPEAADRLAVATPRVEAAPAPRSATVELIDQELRERCLDLFNDFDASGQAHRFDTVISEATRILEDRTRTLCGIGQDVIGVKVMNAAFIGTPPILELSANDGEQRAAHQLYSGVIGFIRNPSHHRIEALERERTLQILAFIDYLLHLVESAATNAQKKSPSTPPPDGV